ncbi:hypothetical protein K438DRAFT_1935000 [Mycena galopus ATCC 62051]|nr:hypothetical protein K438DRAFT_1935000 [Mycena galopus ATCC 62051]
MASSPSLSNLLKSLERKIENRPPLLPSASPGTVLQRNEDNILSRKVASDLRQMLKSEADDALSNEEDDDEGSDNEDPSDALMKAVVSRATAILPKVGSEGPGYLTAADFENLLLDKPAGAQSDIEDAALRRLFAGFASSERAWDAHVGPLLENRLGWDAMCERAQDNAEISDEKQRLLATHTDLARQPEVRRGVSFVDFVLRTIEVLKSAITWKNCTKKWKTTYLKAAFQTDYHGLCRQYDSAPAGSQTKADAKTAMEKEFQRYKKRYGEAMRQRLDLLGLYRQFGPGILLDMTWDIIGEGGPSRPIKRSGPFPKLCKYICANLPPCPDDPDGRFPVKTFVWNGDSLYRILRLLTGSSVVSDHVAAFLCQHPPEDSDTDWTWGEYEQGQNEEAEIRVDFAKRDHARDARTAKLPKFYNCAPDRVPRKTLGAAETPVPASRKILGDGRATVPALRKTLGKEIDDPAPRKMLSAEFDGREGGREKTPSLIVMSEVKWYNEGYRGESRVWQGYGARDGLKAIGDELSEESIGSGSTWSHDVGAEMGADADDSVSVYAVKREWSLLGDDAQAWTRGCPDVGVVVEADNSWVGGRGKLNSQRSWVDDIVDG